MTGTVDWCRRAYGRSSRTQWMASAAGERLPAQRGPSVGPCRRQDHGSASVRDLRRRSDSDRHGSIDFSRLRPVLPAVTSCRLAASRAPIDSRPWPAGAYGREDLRQVFEWRTRALHSAGRVLGPRGPPSDLRPGHRCARAGILAAADRWVTDSGEPEATWPSAGPSSRFSSRVLSAPSSLAMPSSRTCRPRPSCLPWPAARPG